MGRKMSGVEAYMSKELQDLEAAQSSLGISNAFANKVAGVVFDGLAYWIETANERRDGLVLRFKELSSKDSGLRQQIVFRLLKWLFDKEPSKSQVDSAMDAFLKDSQEGSAMSKGKLAGASKQLDLPEETISEISAVAAKIPSAGRSDFVVPGSLLIEYASSRL